MRISRNSVRILKCPTGTLLKKQKPSLGSGLALLWKEGVNVCVINYTNNHILMKIVEDVSFAWFLTGFYGWPEAS